jgi:hypothetical protein
MKATIAIFAAAGLAAVPVLFSSCQQSVTGTTTTTAEVKPGVPGGTVTETKEVRATITAIDSASRKVTMVTPAGEKITITAGPEVANFKQLRVGDQVTVVRIEQIASRMAKPGEVVVDDETIDMSVAPLGKKPGVAMATTEQLVATVTKINTKTRKATLTFSDGSSKTVKVRDDIDLSKHKVGDRVVIRLTDAYALKVESPR